MLNLCLIFLIYKIYQNKVFLKTKQGIQLTDDKLPESPREEIDWAKENATDFNPEMYEQELG